MDPAQNFRELMTAISAKPGMYVGTTSLRDASLYLAGYGHGLMDMGYPDPLGDWMRWIEMKYLISDPAWHWTRILLHVFGTDHAAFDALPSLYAEYSAFVRERGSTGVNEEHYLRFQSTYGKLEHTPETTHTQHLSEK